MRLIGTIPGEHRGRQFSAFLTEKGITNQCEIKAEKDFGNDQYGTAVCNIWVIHEERIKEAVEWFQKLQDDPNLLQEPVAINPEIVSASLKENMKDRESAREKIRARRKKIPESLEQKATLGPISLYLILTCVWVFIWSALTLPSVTVNDQRLPSLPVYSSQVTKDFLFDYPERYERTDALLSEYKERPLPKQLSLPPSWHGIYPFLVSQFSKEIPAPQKAPLFEKIRQGEVWRLFSPIFLHADLIHIAFNMLWLIMLGKQLEKRLRAPRYLSLIFLSAIFSNICQYLMSGPDFIGFSGVICAMLAFVWTRQIRAPWEGYYLQNSTAGFVAIFILAIFLLQTAAFVITIFSGTDLSIPIANTAHLSGAFVGYLLARTDAFSKR